MVRWIRRLPRARGPAAKQGAGVPQVAPRPPRTSTRTVHRNRKTRPAWDSDRSLWWVLVPNRILFVRQSRTRARRTGKGQRSCGLNWRMGGGVRHRRGTIRQTQTKLRWPSWQKTRCHLGYRLKFKTNPLVPHEYLWLSTALALFSVVLIVFPCKISLHEDTNAPRRSASWRDSRVPSAWRPTVRLSLGLPLGRRKMRKEVAKLLA